MPFWGWGNSRKREFYSPNTQAIPLVLARVKAEKINQVEGVISENSFQPRHSSYESIICGGEVGIFASKFKDIERNERRQDLLNMQKQKGTLT